MLRAGSKFRGTQVSDTANYQVEVDIKTVDIAESSLCGFLRIEGMLIDHWHLQGSVLIRRQGWLLTIRY